MATALIFDSGVGGLSVVAEIRKRMPDLRLTYAADDIFRPYGNKARRSLKRVYRAYCGSWQRPAKLILPS